MKKPSVRGKLRLMASGLEVPDNSYKVIGLIKAQQDMELLKLLHTAILANAFLHNDKKTNELVNKALKLIYFEDDNTEVEESERELLKSLRNFSFRIDPSSLPVDQDKLIRKK